MHYRISQRYTGFLVNPYWPLWLSRHVSFSSREKIDDFVETVLMAWDESSNFYVD